MRISRKFAAVLVVLAPLIAAVAVSGVMGLATMRSQFDRVFSGNIPATRLSVTLATQLARGDEVALQLAAASRAVERRSLNAVLDERWSRRSMPPWVS